MMAAARPCKHWDGLSGSHVAGIAEQRGGKTQIEFRRARFAAHRIVERAQALFGRVRQDAAGHENIGGVDPGGGEIAVQIKGQNPLLDRRLHLAGAIEQHVLQGVGNAGGLRHGRAGQ